MKKYLLKGKEYLTKKLQQYEFQTQNIDYVAQQIPNRIRQPLSVLMQEQIDLENTSLYQSYFQNYPTHHLSQFLYQKYLMQLDAKTVPQSYTLPQQDVFIPSFNPSLQQKALLLRQVIEDYDEGYTHVETAVVMMCVIHFHHKRGTEIQYVYPQSSLNKPIQQIAVHHAMPDSSHNKPEDYNFFNFEAPFNGKKRMLFGVSYFKQIKVTEEMRKVNPELTRSYIQKAVAVISTLPLFGYLKLRLSITTKLFFDNFTNFQIVQAAYHDINKSLTQSWPKMTINQLYIGSDLKVIIDLFGAANFYEIWKAILYQKRVVIFAHSSSSASSFILSLLSLFPGLSTFGIFSQPISRYMQSLRQYALPLRTFSSQNFMWMSFHIQDFHHLSRFQKSKIGHFLIGSTNRLLKQANDYGIQLLVNLQDCTIQKKKSRIPWESPTKSQKLFISDLENVVSREKSVGYGGSEDCIRDYFHNYLKKNLYQMIDAMQLFKNFIGECSSYSARTNAPKKQSNEQLIQEDEIVRTFNDQFPPIIPKEVVNMPLPYLLLGKSFTHFLQFHNKNLTRNPPLFINCYQYFLSLPDGQFVLYNILQKKLTFGKGKPDHFQGKEIKFKQNNNLQTKSIFIGMMLKNKYSKSSYLIDTTEIYEGDYQDGAKHGYGKLTNPLHKYIGFFENNLYSGDGQLVTGNHLYVGEFKEGLRHGAGKTQAPNMSYDGEWQNDYPHGQGVLIQNSIQGKGQKIQYIGNFIKGKLDQNSQVTIRYEDGSMYKGGVKENKPNGKGFLVNSQGELVHGIFSEGQLLSKIQTKIQSDQHEENISKNIQKEIKTDVQVEKNTNQQPLG